MIGAGQSSAASIAVRFEPVLAVDTTSSSGGVDPNGQRLALSAMRLPDALQAEQEVRLVYMSDRGQPWTQNVHFSNRFAYVPCQWAGLIQGVVVGSHVDPADVPALTAKLQPLEGTSPVNR